MHRAYGTLEVQIFSGLGEQALIDVLADNLSGIHPLTRWLVGKCARNPRRGKAASAILKSWLKFSGKTQLELAAPQVCGALANLTYWEASAAALGNERLERAFRRCEELRRTKLGSKGSADVADRPQA